MQRALGLTVAVVIGSVCEVAAQSWVNLTPASGAAPAARRNASAILDTAHNRMVIFGGNGGAGYLNDTWELSLSGTPTWRELAPSGSIPIARARSGRQLPPRLSWCFRRAFSTRIRRIASAAAAKKWPRLSQFWFSAETRRSQASCTSAVAWSVWPAGSAAIRAAARRRNSL